MESSSVVLAGPSMHIMPDTCVELVLHFGDPYTTTFSDGTTTRQARSFVVAQMKRSMKIQSNGTTGIIAVRFSALGAYHFFGMPMREISNREVSLSDVWKNQAAELEEKINSTEDADQRSHIIQRYLELQLRRNGNFDKTVDFCVRQIKESRGQISVDELARKAGIGNRQLVRRFDKCIGLSPKEFTRITKFISSLDAMKNSRNGSLTEIALESGYYDQAHFIHDFRQFSGLTPTGYLASTNVVY